MRMTKHDKVRKALIEKFGHWAEFNMKKVAN